MIIIGYQGIGKISLAKNNMSYIDLESSSFFYEGVRPEYWYVYYCNIAARLSRDGYNVFVSSHEVVRNELKKFYPDIFTVCVYPSISLKDKWINKLKFRYNKFPTEKNYKAWMNAVDRYEDNINEIKNCGIPGIEIKSMDYDLDKELDKGIMKLEINIEK